MSDQNDQIARCSSSSFTEELGESHRVAGARFYTALGELVISGISRTLALDAEDRAALTVRSRILEGVRSFRLCSWCHELNEIPHDGSAAFCSSCGHRADLARMDCDCGALGCAQWWPV